MRQLVVRWSKACVGLALATGMTAVLAQPTPATSRSAAAHPQGDHPGRPPELTPAEQDELQESFTKYFHGLEAELRTSKSPRERALSTQLLQIDEHYLPSMADDPVRGELLHKAAQAAPQDHLVQWIWANAPNGGSGCTRANPCPDRGRALAVLEPDNGAAWVPAIARAFDAHDVAGTDEALARMAAAKEYDDKSHEMMEAWDEIVRRFPPLKLPSTIPGIEQPAQGASDPTFVKSLMSMQGGSVAFSTIFVTEACERGAMCGADPRRATNCAKVGRLMLEQGPSIMARAMGLAILKSSPFATAEDHLRIRTFQWQLEQFGRLGQSAKDDPALASRVRDTTNEGEYAEMLEQLGRARMPLTPPGGWNPQQRPEPAFEGCPK